jgi:WD40 repeat protein
MSELCSLQYFFAKCAAGRLRDLVREFKWLSSKTLDPASQTIVSDYSRFLALNVYEFRGKPEVILQQALLLPLSMRPAQEARKLLAMSNHDAVLLPLQNSENADDSVLCNLVHSRQHPVIQVSFVQGTSCLISVSSDSSVKLFDFSLGEEICKLDTPLLCAAAFRCRDDAAFSRESGPMAGQDHGGLKHESAESEKMCIIGGGQDGSIHKFTLPHLTKKTCSCNLPSSIRKVFFASPDAAFVSTNIEVFSIDVESLEACLVYRHHVPITDFYVSKDSSVIVIADDHVSGIICTEARIVKVKRIHEHPVRAVAATAQRHLCASGLKKKRSQEVEGITFFCGVIELWNILNGELVTTLEGHLTAAIASLDFSKDGKYLVSTSQDWQGPRVWDCDSLQCIMVMTSHSEQTVAAQISPDDKTMAVSCDSMGKIKVWAIEGSCRAHKHEGTVRHIKSCSADANLFISAGADSSVRLFELDSKSQSSTELCCIKGDSTSESDGHTSDANRISISADFSKIVSSSDDKSVIVWELNLSSSSRKLKQCARLTSVGWLECVAINASGNLIAAGDNFGTVKMWHLVEETWKECETLASVADFILPDEYRPKDISHATGNNVGCTNISFSQDANIMLVSRADGMMGVYTKVQSRKFSGGFFSSETAHRITRADGCVEVFAEIMDDACSVLSVGDSRLRVWDIRSQHSPEFITEYHLSGPGRRFIFEAEKVVVSTWNDWVEIFRSNQNPATSSALHWCRAGLIPFAKLLHSSRVDGFILRSQVLIYGDDKGKIGSWELIDASLSSTRIPSLAGNTTAQSRL